MAHQLAWYIHSGRWVKNLDHLNGFRSDNRIENLREATKTENSRNQGIHNGNTSGVTGVCWHKRKNKWIASIKTDDGLKHLGYFDCLAEAAKVRKAAEMLYGYHPNHGTRKATQIKRRRN